MTALAKKPRAVGGLCWLCDRRLSGGGRFYRLVEIDGVQRPAHKHCGGETIEQRAKRGIR